jgi:hypothetical protein
MRRAAPLALTIGIAAVLAGCFTTSADFKNDAENYIADEVAPVLEVEFVTVDCDEPVTQDVGTRFECRATDTAGGEWVFDNEISDENEFTVNVDRAP